MKFKNCMQALAANIDSKLGIAWTRIRDDNKQELYKAEKIINHFTTVIVALSTCLFFIEAKYSSFTVDTKETACLCVLLLPVIIVRKIFDQTFARAICQVDKIDEALRSVNPSTKQLIEYISEKRDCPKYLAEISVNKNSKSKQELSESIPLGSSDVKEIIWGYLKVPDKDLDTIKEQYLDEHMPINCQDLSKALAPS